MKHLKHIFLFVFLCVFYSCSDTHQLKSEDDKNCTENYRILVSAPDSLPTISFNFHDNSDSVYQLVLGKFPTSESCDTINFGYKIRNEKILVTTRVSPCNETYCGIYPFLRLELNINNSVTAYYPIGNLSLEHHHKKIFQLDSIEDVIVNNYFEGVPKNKLHIMLVWYAYNDVVQINRLIKKTIYSIFRIYENHAEKLFGKKICELSTEEIINLKHELPIYIWFQQAHPSFHIKPPLRNN